MNFTVPAIDPDAAPEAASVGRPMSGLRALTTGATLAADGDRSTI